MIVHGIGGYAGIHWQGWLKQELERRDYRVVMPTLPAADHPDRTTWRRAVTRIMNKHQSEPLIIVTHSLGVVSVLDALEQSENRARALISVSGFCSDYGAELNSYFLKEKPIDFARVVPKLKKSVVLFGDNDPYVPQANLKELALKLKVKPIIIKHGGHLNTDAGYTRFPRLVGEIM